MFTRSKFQAISLLILSAIFLTTCANVSETRPLKSGASIETAEARQAVNGDPARAEPGQAEPLRLRPLEPPAADPLYAEEGDRPGADISERRLNEFRIYNQLLSLMGIPGLFPANSGSGDYGRPQESGRLERNPDGSYGAQSSSLINPDFERLPERALSQAMSAGAGAVTTWAEGWFGGFGKAKIRLNPTIDGYVTGSLDFLSPVFDSDNTTVFTQIGVRAMAGERVIGNLGLGQRWLWEDWALGYNAFLDQDFTRGHMRGGAGLELWLDWLRLGANYYKPLSRPTPSKDFDDRYIQESPAEGWDARVTGYLPFYRNLSLSAAVERWDGEYVGAFGHSNVLASKPAAWVLGLGWTPAPILTVDAQTRSYKSHTETSVGLSINYMFGVPLADQLRSSAVAELTTIDGSRHDFVQRQNEMVLEYRAKPGEYRIVVEKIAGDNTFSLTIYDGFGNKVAGLPVRLVS